MTETWEIIFPYKKEHSEICPVCNPNDTDEDAEAMTRRSSDVYQCNECGLLIMAGFDRYKMGTRVILGHVDSHSCPIDTWEPGSGPPIDPPVK